MKVFRSIKCDNHEYLAKTAKFNKNAYFLDGRPMNPDHKNTFFTSLIVSLSPTSDIYVKCFYDRAT